MAKENKKKEHRDRMITLGFLIVKNETDVPYDCFLSPAQLDPCTSRELMQM